ncbi:MAG: hypothetical protein HY303_18640 [Candidatus Wallbacteria bacterium]|nr:hypothetical protein [Candidatus Wallbacteria bacterium]
MDILVANTEVVLDDFVGHIVFYVHDSGVLGHCFEHEMLVDARNLDEAGRMMRRAIKSVLNAAAESFSTKARCYHLAARYVPDILSAAPFDIYRLISKGKKKSASVGNGPSYLVGILNEKAAAKAA